jgi:hypothetical protein
MKSCVCFFIRMVSLFQMEDLLISLCGNYAPQQAGRLPRGL